ncbi:MAG: hypothetical protein C3F07_07210 [Anaerolineales bacterium]|nr:hypothetical protein [Anaerolineae bacterium]PWB74586.1 MAG: hypothetical protein C3F07_07210 [Anaerolineales bacterium]
MYNKPLTQQNVATVDVSEDFRILGRVLIAAAINPHFCARLLSDPEAALSSGFGGEKFPVSGETMKAVSSIRESSLPEFIQVLDSGLGKRLLSSDSLEAPG